MGEMTDRQTQRLAEIPERYRRVFRLAYDGESWKSQARAFCIYCMGMEGHDIPECTAEDCPHWTTRRGAARPDRAVTPKQAAARTAAGERLRKRRRQ